MIEKTIANAIITQIGSGIPKGFAANVVKKPVFPKSGLPANLVKVSPLVINFAKPRATYNIPRVAINGAIFNLATSSPLSQPNKMPTINEITSTAQIFGYAT